MEEAKADALYRLFKQTDAGARHKQGLGFATGEATSSGGRWTKGGDAAPAPSLSSMFVKAGDSKADAVAPKATARQHVQQDGQASAARVATRLAELKASKAAQQGAGDARLEPTARSLASREAEGSAQATGRQARISNSRSRSKSRGRGRSRSRSREGARGRGHESDRGRGRERGRDRSQRSRSPDHSRDQIRQHEHDRYGSSGRYDREDHRDRDRGRDYSRDTGREGSRDRERERDRERSRSRGRDRTRDRSRDRARDRSRSRDHSRDRNRDKGGSRDRNEARRSNSHYDRHRDDRQDRGSDRDSKRVARNGKQLPPASKSSSTAIDWSRVIPGYNKMSLGEQLRARTAYQLQKADKDSVHRAANEAREEARDAQQEGREVDAAAVRPWTRYVFDSTAPLEEDGARPVAAHNQNEDGLADELGAPDEAARLLGVEGEGEQLNMVSFKASTKQLQTKERDDKHAAAIFGSAPTNAASHASTQSSRPQQPQQVQGGRGGQHEELSRGVNKAVGQGPDHLNESDENQAGGSEHHGTVRAQSLTDQDTLKAVLAGKRDWSSVVDEDGPVLVMMDQEDQQQPAAATEQDTNGPNAPMHVGHAAVAQSLLEKQQGMSWRDRAQQARQQKAASAAAVAMPAPAAERGAEAGHAENVTGQQAPLVLQLNWRDKARARKAAAG